MLITDPAELRAELAIVRHEPAMNVYTPAIGYVTPNDEHTGQATRSVKHARPGSKKPRKQDLHITKNNDTINKSSKPPMWCETNQKIGH